MPARDGPFAFLISAGHSGIVELGSELLSGPLVPIAPAGGGGSDTATQTGFRPALAGDFNSDSVTDGGANVGNLGAAIPADKGQLRLALPANAVVVLQRRPGNQ
jgi:hypothetical protein